MFHCGVGPGNLRDGWIPQNQGKKTTICMVIGRNIRLLMMKITDDYELN